MRFLLLAYFLDLPSLVQMWITPASFFAPLDHPCRLRHRYQLLRHDEANHILPSHLQVIPKELEYGHLADQARKTPRQLDQEQVMQSLKSACYHRQM